jgi:hypothetical protein
MKTLYTDKDVDVLYDLIGQSVWYLQHLELAVSTFTALKILQRKREKGTKITEQIGERILSNQRGLTLGPLISSAKREKTMPENLWKRFDKFIKERNWLIHNCVITDYMALRNEDNKKALFNRFEEFTNEAVALKKEIYNLLEIWYSSKGYDLDYAYNLAEETLRNAE